MTDDEIVKKVLAHAGKPQTLCISCMYYDENNIKFNCIKLKEIVGLKVECVYHKPI
jgi:hypothetical protein